MVVDVVVSFGVLFVVAVAVGVVVMVRHGVLSCELVWRGSGVALNAADQVRCSSFDVFGVCVGGEGMENSRVVYEQKLTWV